MKVNQKFRLSTLAVHFVCLMIVFVPTLLLLSKKYSFWFSAILSLMIFLAVSQVARILVQKRA